MMPLEDQELLDDDDLDLGDIAEVPEEEQLEEDDRQDYFEEDLSDAPEGDEEDVVFFGEDDEE
jgi:hypothetical protein